MILEQLNNYYAGHIFFLLLWFLIFLSNIVKHQWKWGIRGAVFGGTVFPRIALHFLLMDEKSDDPPILLILYIPMISIVSSVIMFVLASQMSRIFAGRGKASENVGALTENTRMYPRNATHVMMLSTAGLLVLALLFFGGIRESFSQVIVFLLTGMLLASIVSLLSTRRKRSMPRTNVRTLSHHAIFIFVTFVSVLSAFHWYSQFLENTITNPATSSKDLKALSENFFVEQNYSLLGDIARSENTPPEVLEELSRHHDSNIQLIIVHNAKTPCHVLRRFAESDRAFLKDKAQENYARNCKQLTR